MRAVEFPLDTQPQLSNPRCIRCLRLYPRSASNGAASCHIRTLRNGEMVSIIGLPAFFQPRYLNGSNNGETTRRLV